MVSDESRGRQYFKYAGLGLEFTGIVLLFFYFGHLADQRWDSDPWGLMIGGAIGLTGGIYLLAKEGYKAMGELDATVTKKDSDEET